MRFQPCDLESLPSCGRSCDGSPLPSPSVASAVVPTCGIAEEVRRHHPQQDSLPLRVEPCPRAATAVGQVGASNPMSQPSSQVFWIRSVFQLSRESLSMSSVVLRECEKLQVSQVNRNREQTGSAHHTQNYIHVVAEKSVTKVETVVCCASTHDSSARFSSSSLLIEWASCARLAIVVSALCFSKKTRSRCSDMLSTRALVSGGALVQVATCKFAVHTLMFHDWCRPHQQEVWY